MHRMIIIWITIWEGDTYRFDFEDADREGAGHFIDNEDYEVPLSDGSKDEHNREEHLRSQNKSIKLKWSNLTCPWRGNQGKYRIQLHWK